jgi:hypothetical protein
MKIKLDDWVEHAVFGIGQVFEERGEKLSVRFVNSGDKMLIRSALWPVTAPRVTNSSGISGRRVKAKRGPKTPTYAND